MTSVRFILPWSKRQSKIKLREKYSVGLEVYPFERLNPKRIEVINCLGINMDEPLPLWRRLKGRFWESLEFWVLPPPVQEFIVESTVVLSPLFGLLKVDTPIPYAEHSWEDQLRRFKAERLVEGSSQRSLKGNLQRPSGGSPCGKAGGRALGPWNRP
jgi:hypothetical protein